MRILVVEDDQLLNKTLSYNLSAVGYSVDGAMSKAVAIRFLEKQDYDLIVLDVNLPDGNGFDICHEVKERRPDTAVIFLTANDMESDMLKGFELGADDYVTKPFPISVFQKKVSALLNRISAQSGGDFYDDGNLYINFSELSACLAGQPITLTSLEYRLLKVLTRNSQTVLTRQVLCIVLFNSIIIVTQSMDEEKWITRTTKTDFTVYNSIAVNVQEGFRHHEDALPQQVVDMIREQNGLEEERYLYRNTVDDGNVLVDYGFEGLTCTNTFEYENGISKSFGNYALNTAPDAENLFFGNVYGASEHFWSDMMIYDGETDPNVLKQKMLTGEYVIIGNRLDRLSGGPKTTSLSEQLQIGDSISFYRDGELVKTCTILAKACTVGTEDETPTTTTATMHIGGDAPFVYLPDTVFKQIYTTPTLLNYGFNMDASLHPQMEDFLSSYVEKNPSVTYTSTKLLKEQLNSVASMVWVVGSLIGCIMALAGLINFTNMIITNIITRRHEFATMQSIGMTNRQLQRLMVYEGVYYAAGADIIGGVVALLLAVTVLKNVLNSPSMWFFTLHITLVPALVIGVLYLLLAAVIPLIVLHFFNKGTVVERLRTSE